MKKHTYVILDANQKVAATSQMTKKEVQRANKKLSATSYLSVSGSKQWTLQSPIK